ncbi:MAG: TonB-dependent receptor [Candidatus Sulfotelmatobacter sp.]
MRSLVVSSPGYLGRHVRQSCLIVATFLLTFGIQAFAQEATIVGTVTDPSGAAVTNATITITNNDTGVQRTLPSNGDGQYVAPDLHIGQYTVRASAAGFKVAEQKGVTLNVGDRIRLDFKLQVGSAQEQVTVEANAVAVQTDSGEVSNVITGQQVTQLATNGRSLYELFALAPGAVSLQSSRISFTPVSGDSTVSINGERAGHNLQLIDGGENLDRGGSSGSVMPSLDSIAEFRNMTSNYSAEYGLATASQISTVIKSGTKQYHGEAWEFFRNDALNARNYFNPYPNAVAELRYNIFGANIGGQVPIAKSHPTFFFFNMEWRREVDGGLLNQLVPPTSAYPDANGAGTGAVLPATVNGETLNAVVPTGIANFGSNCSAAVMATLTPGQPFPSNTIPDCLISPNASALLVAGGKYGGIFPGPTNSAGFFQGGNNSPTTLREEIVRIDHTFSNKFSIFGHWISEQVAQNFGTTMWSGDNDPAISNTFGNPAYSAVIHATHVISPTVLNEIAFNYNGNRISILPQGLFTAPSAFGFNRLFTGTNADSRIPAINLSGVTGTNYTVNWMPWTNKADDYQFRDDLSWTRGAHQLKFGFSYAIYKKIQDAFANTEGNFTFNGSFTSPNGANPGSCTASKTLSCGYDFADYLLGYAQQYSEDGAQISGHWNNISPALYLQDNWRVNSRLTLNLGLRWDGIPHTYEASHLSSNFYPNMYNQANAATFEFDSVTSKYTGNICGPNSSAALCPGGPSPGLVSESAFGGYNFYLNGIGVGGVNGVPKGLVNNSWNNWGPRLGFAYDLTGQGKTVLRGGYGVTYERIQGNDMYNGAVNPPGDPNPTLNGVSLDNPGLNLGSGNVISAANLPVLPLGVTGIATNFPPPRSSQYSLGIQQAVSTHAVLTVSYVGSQGRHEDYYQAVNLPPLSALPAQVAAGALSYPTLTYPGIGNMRLATDGANSRYNSLQTSLNGTIHRDLHMQVAYTLARAKDATTSTGSGGDLNNATNPYAGWSYDYGPSIYNRNNVFFANFVYDLPFFRSGSNLTKAALGGWEVASIVTVESGAPINLGISGVNTAASVISNSGDRPNITGGISYPKTVGQWFTGNFGVPACATGPDCYGNLGFDAVTGPGRSNWDFSLLKDFSFTERFKLEFRAEAFNVFNHPQFQGNANTGGLGNNFGSGTFGQITSAYDPREFQLALKLKF